MVSTIANLAAEQGIPLWLLIVVLIWSLFWKGLAWWKSARLNQPIWFVSFFIINTLGILEILYIFLFSKEEFLTSFRNSSPKEKVSRVSRKQSSSSRISNKNSLFSRSKKHTR